MCVCVCLSCALGGNFVTQASTTVGVTSASSQTSTPPQQDLSVTASPITLATENIISSTSLPTLFTPVQRPHPPSGIALLKCLGSVADNVVNEFNLQVKVHITFLKCLLNILYSTNGTGFMHY